MGWTVPDRGTAPADAQSILFQTYLDVLSAGLSGDGYVQDGCAVTGNGDLQPSVAAGSVVASGVTYQVPGARATVGAADPTNARFDLVAVSSSGIVVRAGTAAAAPKPPALLAGDVVLAVVYVAPGATAITSSQCVDMRILRADLQSVATELAAADTTKDVADLERRFRLLLKQHFMLFNDVPPGLESEIPLALATD